MYSLKAVLSWRDCYIIHIRHAFVCHFVLIIDRLPNICLFIGKNYTGTLTSTQTEIRVYQHQVQNSPLASSVAAGDFIDTDPKIY